MAYIISGIQQLGVGVSNVEAAWKWYRAAFGMDVPVFQDEAEAPLMTRYTGAAVQKRNAVLALNLRGGAGFEIWQFTSRTPSAPAQEPVVGDYGIFAGVIKSNNVAEAYRRLEKLGANLCSPPMAGPDGASRFFVRDPWGNLFQIAPSGDWFGTPGPTGGVGGVIIGTSSIDSSLRLYRDVLGYDTVLFDVTGIQEDFTGLANGDAPVRRILLTHSRPRSGPFSRLMGASTVELVQLTSGEGRRIFADRFWGDLGFIHLCFDVRNMNELAAACALAGHPFTIDSGDTFDMGSAGGRFSYVEDHDGTLIEFVETHKLPLLKGLGLGLNLQRRPDEKPLPRWLIRLLGLARVRD